MSLKFPVSLVGNRVGSIPVPLHWWDLDSLSAAAGEGLDDQGAKLTHDMALTAVNSPTVDSGDAPDGGNSIYLGGVDKYLNTSSDFTWDGASNTTMSVSIWVKVVSLSSTGNWLINWRNTSADFLFQLFVNNSTAAGENDFFRAIGYDDSETSVEASDSAEQISTPPTNWIHAVITINTAGEIKLYQDGSLIDTTDASALGDFETTNVMPFAIGASAWSPTVANLHIGNVWAAGIWDKELNQSQIDHLYNNGNGRKYADLNI